MGNKVVVAGVGNAEWFRIRVKEMAEQALIESARSDGKKIALEEVGNLTNSDKYCQVCGYGYNTWSGPGDKIKHDATHQETPPTPPATPTSK